MRASALLSRTKKFFSKKRRVAKFELGQIHADGFSRARVENDSREFHSKALKYEDKAAFHTFQEKKLKRLLHNLKSEGNLQVHENLPSLSTPSELRNEISLERNESLIHANKASEARKNATMRRLYLQKMLKLKSKK